MTGKLLKKRVAALGEKAANLIVCINHGIHYTRTDIMNSNLNAKFTP